MMYIEHIICAKTVARDMTLRADIVVHNMTLRAISFAHITTDLIF